MNIFYSHYKCHPDALVMNKKTGDVHKVRGNVGLWNMDVVIVPMEQIIDTNREIVAVLNSEEFERTYLVLYEGEDQLKSILSTVNTGLTKPPKI